MRSKKTKTLYSGMAFTLSDLHEIAAFHKIVKNYLKMKNQIAKNVVCILIALIPLSCGTRKASTAISNTDQKDIQEQSSKGNVSKTSSSSESNIVNTNTDKTDEKQESIVTELFYENGALKERISQLLNSKSVDKSIKQEQSIKYVYTNTDSTFNNHYYHDRTITVYVKDKDVSSNRNGIYFLYGFGVLVLGILVYLRFIK